MISAPLARASVDELEHLRHRVRAALAALRRAGLLGEIHHQQRGLLGDDAWPASARGGGGNLAVPHSSIRVCARRGRRAATQARGHDLRPAESVQRAFIVVLPRLALPLRCRLAAAAEADKAVPGLNSCVPNGQFWWPEERISLAQDVPDRRDADQPGAAQRALARDFPPDRRELSGHRRAARLAQPVAADHHAAVARLGAQRHGRPRAARPDLCAAHLGRPAADRTGPALLRRCADADRRSRRSRPARDRGPGRRRRQVDRGGADRGLRPAVRPDARGRRGADREIERAAQAHRVRAARARARAGRAGRRGRPGREPHRQPADRPADLGADRGRQLPQRAYPRQDAGRGQGRAGAGARRRPGRARPADAEDHRRRARELVGRRERRAQADRARRRRTCSKTSRRSRTWSGCGCCSTISRPSAT